MLRKHEGISQIYLSTSYLPTTNPTNTKNCSNTNILFRCEMYGTVDRDSPIDLLSITRYMADTISIWDILAELVLLTTEPPPANPFDIDHTYLDNLSSVEQVGRV